jgi:alkylation response protein AidB-like acyl-CoA dehydrogenase
VATRAWKQDGTTVMTFKRSILVPKKPMSEDSADPRCDLEVARARRAPQGARAREEGRVPGEDGRADEGTGPLRRDDPEEYGGLGLSASTYAKIVAQISEVWMSLTGIFNSHLIMAAAVARYGTEEQKQRFLPKFASGEMRGGLALTEPDCGTDLQAIRTRAVKDGKDYVINGTKTWISNGIKGSCFALLVKTDPNASPRHKGMTMFLAEKGKGFKVSKKLEKLGYKGIDSAS